MKKTLTALATGMLAVSSGPTIISLTNISFLNHINLGPINKPYILNDNDSNRKSINVPHTTQENSYYCVAACVYSIFSYRGELASGVTQTTIFNDNHGVHGEGMETDQSLVNYINANIHSGDSNQNYELREINQHWFANDANFQMFNAYIVHSLVNHCPILIGYPYFRSGIRTAHASLITELLLIQMILITPNIH